MKSTRRWWKILATHAVNALERWGGENHARLHSLRRAVPFCYTTQSTNWVSEILANWSTVSPNQWWHSGVINRRISSNRESDTKPRYVFTNISINVVFQHISDTPASIFYLLQQYLGSTLVKHLKGTESTKRSIQKLKTKHSTDSSLSASVLLAISLNGVQFLSPMTKVQSAIHYNHPACLACRLAKNSSFPSHAFQGNYLQARH